MVDDFIEKTRLNYWVDVALLIVFIVSAVTGLVVYFAFTSGQPGVGRNLTFMGTSKSDWQPWHAYSGIAMVILVLVHLILNFGFLTSMTRSLSKKDEVAVTPVAKSLKNPSIKII